jgi:pimeloyl-ACP methyl ester carboxylesterase
VNAGQPGLEAPPTGGDVNAGHRAGDARRPAFTYGRLMTADEVELGEAGGLAYRSAGSGRPLVLLHPGPGLDGSVFFPEALTVGTRVVALDLPGNGRSPAGDRAEWTISGYARSVMRAVRALGFQPGAWDLLGHSFGGFIALELNKQNPGELTRIVASCTDASEAPPPGDPPGALYGLSEEEAAAVEDAWQREGGATTPEALRDGWLDQLDYYAGSPEGAERLRERWRGVTYQTGPNLQQDWGELEALDALAGVAVLAIAGERDRMPRSLQQRIADASPRGTLAVIEGAGHFPFAETPDRYWPVVARWLEETAAAR